MSCKIGGEYVSSGQEKIGKMWGIAFWEWCGNTDYYISGVEKLFILMEVLMHDKYD